MVRFFCKAIIKTALFFILFCCFLFAVQAQKSKADSLKELLSKEKIDTNKIRFLWQLAQKVNIYNPDTAILLAQQALSLSKKIKYEDGQSRSLGVLSNCFIKIGNYPRALELNIEKLQLEEKRNIPRNMASVLMNIGVIYVMQKEYNKALVYYKKSDSVISLYNVEDLKYYITLNMGDAFNRLNISDSAYAYFNKSLQIAKEMPVVDYHFIGSSLTGLGHSFLKLGKPELSLFNYRSSITYLRLVNDDDALCEATLGVANLYQQLKKYDSSKFYATQSYLIAKKDGFLSKELEAAEFLTENYRITKNIDSAFAYINIVKTLNDSVNSANRIRESQIISSNEQYRQFEIEESNKLAKEERRQRLQLLFIGMFIPGLFLFTMLLSRVKVNIKVIRVLGILSLMFFFEYITILLHPAISNFTHHTPWLEILLFVAIGIFLVPAHHRLEHWLIQKLLSHKITDVHPLIINEKADTQNNIPDLLEAEDEIVITENDLEVIDAGKDDSIPKNTEKCITDKDDAKEIIS